MNALGYTKGAPCQYRVLFLQTSLGAFAGDSIANRGSDVTKSVDVEPNQACVSRHNCFDCRIGKASKKIYCTKVRSSLFNI